MAGRRPAQAPPRRAIREKGAAELGHLNSRLNDQLRQDLSREIYTRNVLKHKEDAVVAQIRVASSFRSEESPESEQYVTPKASPSSDQTHPIHQSFSPSTDERAHYYSIAHVEADFEKELAEQDALSHSFRSMIDREEESKKPTTLDFTRGETDFDVEVKDLNRQRAETLQNLNRRLLRSNDNEMSGGKEEISSGYATSGSSVVRNFSDVEEFYRIPEYDSVVLTSTNNFFIDASSLRDEDELLYPPKITGPVNELQKTGVEPMAEVDVSTEPTPLKTQLIRRNTFELDANDEQLAMLKEEYEKNNGLQKEDEEVAVVKNVVEELVQGAVELDGNSPDSLNTDFPYDLFKAEVPIKEDEIKEPQVQLNGSAFSDISNSSGPNCSSSASSKRDEDTDDTRSSCISFNRGDSAGPSPLMSRRRNEHAPILSGCGDAPQPEPRRVQSGASSLNTSWVVNFDDIKVDPPQGFEEKRRRSGGTGFFVSLDDHDLYPSIDSVTSNGSESSKKSCGFFIDLKSDSDSETNKNKRKTPSGPEKKLFSMFIDFGGEGAESPKSKPSSPFLGSRRAGTKAPLPQILQERLSGHKKSTSTSSDSGLDCGENPEVLKGRLLFDSSSDPQGHQSRSDSLTNDSAFSTKRQSFYMFNEKEELPGVVMRRTIPSNVPRATANRHSWNSDKMASSGTALNSNDSVPAVQHKRSSSVSFDTVNSDEDFRLGAMSLSDMPLAKGEPHKPVPKPSSELTRIIQNGARREFKESRARKSTEVQSESEASGLGDSTDGNRTFVIDEVSKVVNMSNGCMELSTPSQDVVSELSKDDKSGTSGDLTPKQVEVPEKSAEPKGMSTSVFVKLSDMDNHVAPTFPVKTSSRMTRSIPGETSMWLDTGPLADSPSSRSLSRLFPHLYPRKGIDGTSASDADISNQSSINSSIGPSPLEVSSEGFGESEDSIGPGCPPSRLGQDLLRMFLEGISPDVTVDVGGRRIKAHKCILSSRCQYFAGILSGGWVESAGNVISLQGFTYNTVHFALCHIYSGASNIPDTINIVELATLADMLCLEGLKEVIMYTLKFKYCHFFHKPCSGCIVGVLECLPLAAAYGLDEIYRKSLRWITKHFVKVWPTKGFASLPKELLDKCYKQHLVHMGSENVLGTIMGCEKLEATLPNVRWAQPVLNMNNRLQEVSNKYLVQHFSNVISSDAFMTIGKEDVWTVTKLEEALLTASRNLSPDQSCQSYKKITYLTARIPVTEFECKDEWTLEFEELLISLEKSIEDCLVRQAGRAARTSSWAQMDIGLRKKIQEMACLVLAPGPRSSSVSKVRDSVASPRHTARPLSERGNRSLPCQQNQSTPHKKPIVPAASVKPQPKSLTPSSVPRSAQRPSSVPKPAPNRTVQSSLPRPKTNQKLAQVKSRYLEPRPVKKEATVEVGPKLSRKPVGSASGKVLSSSDSSRTSSPAASRVVKSRPSSAGSAPLKCSKTPNGSGSGGNPSPVTGGPKQTNFRGPTRSSTAKMNAPRAPPAALTTRSGTFLKDSPTTTKKPANRSHV